MEYKKEMYDRYHSIQNIPLYGKTTLESVKKKFRLWDYLYGDLLPGDITSSILDIGCGNGSFLYYLREKGYKICKGIDISEEQIEAGSKLGIQDILQADIITFLREAKEKYDFIIARDVLEHFAKPEIFEILNLILSNLNDNGRILIQVPNGEGIWHQKIFYGDLTHETLLSKDSARQLLLAAGFKKMDFYQISFPVVNLRSFLRKGIWKVMVFQQRFRKWIATGEGSGIFTPNMLIVAEKG